MTEKREVTVYFQDGCSQYFATEQEVAELALTTGKANAAPLCEPFKAAVSAALEGTNITASNFTLESLFYVLLLVTCQEDSHTLLLSRRVRDSIGQRDGISIAVVRVQPLARAYKSLPCISPHLILSRMPLSGLCLSAGRISRTRPSKSLSAHGYHCGSEHAKSGRESWRGFIAEVFSVEAQVSGSKL